MLNLNISHLKNILRTESAGRMSEETRGDTECSGSDKTGDGEREREERQRKDRVGTGKRGNEGGDLRAQRQHEGKL